MHFGIDISSNNLHPIDYVSATAALRNLGVGSQPFVIVKAIQGTGYINPDFAADVAGFRAAGAAIGAYLMDQGNDSVSSEEQFFIRVAGGLPQFNDDELPMGNDAYAQHCAQLVGQNPAALDYLNQSEENEGYPAGAGYWEANYNGQPGVTNRPALMHQFRDDALIAGIGGQVDLNAWLGTEFQFAQVFHLTIPSPPPGGSFVANLEAPIIDVVYRPQGDGYWMIGADGGIDNFGAAPAFTNNPLPGLYAQGKLTRPITGAAVTPSGNGLMLVGGDGGNFPFGDAKSFGNIPGAKIGPAPAGVLATKI